MKVKNTITLDLSKFRSEYEPFKRLIWVNVKTPIVRYDIQKAIREKRLKPPGKVRQSIDGYDNSRKKTHIERIAWLVVNWKEQSEFNISIDFDCNPSYVTDGNHRLMAAYFKRKRILEVNIKSKFSENKIQKFSYQK